MRPVDAATATMSGAWTSSARSAWAEATSFGTPSPTSRSMVASRAARRSSVPSFGSTAASRSKPSRPAAIVDSKSAPGAQVRYQRAVDSTSASIPPSSSICAARPTPVSPSIVSHSAFPPVTSTAIRNARTTSPTSAPRSLTSDDTNVGPSPLTTAFALIMQISWVRSWCSPSRCPQRSTTASGK